MLKYFRSFAVLLGILSLFAQCMPSTQEVDTDVSLDLKDPTYRKIYTYQDKLLTDSLLPFLNHKDAKYRYAAALSFASIKDEKALNGLVALLNDNVLEVKQVAAYAIGQIGSDKAEDALAQAFVADTTQENQSFKQILLEAVGKSSSERSLQYLGLVDDYRREDTLAMEGLLSAFYRYALRGMTTKEGTDRMLDILSAGNYSDKSKMIAANYLYRAKNIQLDSVAGVLYKVAQREDDIKILSPLAIAIGKTKHPVGLEALKYLYGKTDDYRVRVNVIRAMSNFDYLAVKDIVLNAVKEKNEHTAIAASAFLIDNGYAREAKTYYDMALEQTLPWQVSVNLLRAANKNMPKYFTNSINLINGEIRRRFENDENDNLYYKRALLMAFAENPRNYKYIYEQGMKSEEALIRSGSVEALSYIVNDETFPTGIGRSNRVKKEFGGYFKEAIEAGNSSMVAIGAQALRTPNVDFQEVLDSIGFIELAMNKLVLPKESEIQYELQKTKDYFNGKTSTVNEIPAHNHTIDWAIVDGINSNAEADIFTQKGKITIKLLLNEAPASVANFVQLARNNFFDNKKIHRVVPNFVVQAGCPIGDGYGSLDYTIRSELGPMSYDDEGYVGMASAGNHTEGVQWFITHSPALHLDGNYTIFAKVVDGMDVVHKLQIGDKISDIKIRN